MPCDYTVFMVLIGHCLQRAYVGTEISEGSSSCSKANQGPATQYSARDFHSIANLLYISKSIGTRGYVVSTPGAKHRGGCMEVGGGRRRMHWARVEGVSREAHKKLQNQVAAGRRCRSSDGKPTTFLPEHRPEMRRAR